MSLVDIVAKDIIFFISYSTLLQKYKSFSKYGVILQYPHGYGTTNT